MCKTNVQTDLAYANMNIKENITRLWCKIVSKTGVEQTKRNEGTYFYLYPFGDFNPKKFPKMFLCVHRVKKLLENLPNRKSTMN
jgi:hypothetical protein